jgi:phage gpG-like protein
MAKKTIVQFVHTLKDTRGRWARSTPEVEKKAKKLFKEDVQNSFDQSRSPEGVAYPPLRVRVGKPLVLSGRLEAASIRAVEAAKWVGNRLNAKLASSRVRYGRFHQFGTRKIPVRKFFGYSKSSVKAIAKFIAKQAAKAAVGKT